MYINYDREMHDFTSPVWQQDRLIYNEADSNARNTTFTFNLDVTFLFAVLCCAVLCCAVLCCAVLCCAVLCCAVLCCAGLSSAASAERECNAVRTCIRYTLAIQPRSSEQSIRSQENSKLQLRYALCCPLLPSAALCCPLLPSAAL